MSIKKSYVNLLGVMRIKKSPYRCRYLQSSIFLLTVASAPLYSSNYAQLIGQTTSCSYPLKKIGSSEMIPRFDIRTVREVIPKEGRKSLVNHVNICIGDKITSKDIFFFIVHFLDYEPESKSLFSPIYSFFYSFFYTPYKILNTLIPNTQQSLINYFIQTNEYSTLFYHDINFLLEHKADPNLPNRYGNTICHIYYNGRYYNENFNGAALEEKKIKVFTDNLTVLLKNNADISVQNREGNTPLHIRYAAKYLHLPIVYPTLDKQGVLNIPNNKGVTPFMMFIAKSVTHSATQYVLTHLKNHLYASSNALVTDKKENTLLHYLVRHRNLTHEEIKALYNDYAKILHVKNKDRRSALDMFCYDLPPSERCMLEKELRLKEGSLKDIVDEHGNTFLHRYMWLYNKCSVNVTPILTLLKLAEGQITQKNIYGQTPIHFFMKIHNFLKSSNSFKNLFSNGFLTKELLNTQDNKGNTVLYTLFRNCHFYPELIPYVLCQAPDLTIPNKSGNTPMHALIHLLTKNKYLIDFGNSRCAHPEDTTYKKPIILPALPVLLQLKNNRGETPLLYTFSKECHISAKRIGMMVLNAIKDDKKLESINTTLFYRIVNDHTLYSKEYCEIDPSLVQANERIMDLRDTVESHYAKLMAERLYETMIYVDRKYKKYSPDLAHAVWIMKHLTTTTLPKQYKGYVLPYTLRKLIADFLPCPLSMSICNVIIKLVKNVDVTKQDMLALQKSARKFKLADYRLANDITQCCRIIPKR